MSLGDVDTDTGLFVQYRPSSTAQGSRCWDCKRRFGKRYARVIRGMQSGGLSAYEVCTRCVANDLVEIRTGRASRDGIWWNGASEAAFGSAVICAVIGFIDGMVAMFDGHTPIGGILAAVAVMPLLAVFGAIKSGWRVGRGGLYKARVHHR